jgi:hypothetical protein
MSHARTQSFRLGIGEYETAKEGEAHGEQSIADARDSFINTIGKEASDVLKDLRDLFDSYRDAVLNKPPDGPPENLLRHLLTDEDEMARCQELCSQAQIEFRQALFAWSKKWNLDADWCREWGRLQLWYWSELPGEKECLGIYFPEHGGSLLVPTPPEGLPRWIPEIQTKKAYLDELEEQAERRVDSDALLRLGEVSYRKAFIKTIRARAEALCEEVEKHLSVHEPSLRRVPEVRSLLTHMTWTVKYQVRGMNFRQIALKSEVTSQAVAKAVRSALELIDLREREGARQGRPREG